MILRIILAIGLLGVLGCTKNPATGESDFTLFMSPAQEARIGAQEHSKIIHRFGGVYDDPLLGGYIATIGGRLVANSEMPNYVFTFTILNSQDVNAFALPGGYVYVTRGLIALANSEAELASVIAHEIGHIVARHTAQRYSHAMAGEIGGILLGAIFNVQGLGNITQLGSELYLASFSREQEYQADKLGIRYITNAGYSSKAMSDFLGQLILHKKFKEKIRDEKTSTPSFLSTHPDTPNRVKKSKILAGNNKGITKRKRFLKEIDGLLFGDDPAEGMIKANKFVHPALRFELEVPKDFLLINTSSAVFARKKGEALMIFQIAKPEDSHPDPLIYLKDIWAPKLFLKNLKRIEINGYSAATARAEIDGRIDDYSGRINARFFAVQFEQKMLMKLFFLARPDKTADLEKNFRNIVFSIKYINKEQVGKILPLRLRIHSVNPLDTQESISAKSKTSVLPLEHFRLLNSIYPGEILLPGRLVKVIRN